MKAAITSADFPGLTDKPLHFFSVLQKQVELNPNKCAIIFAGRSYSYTEIYQRSLNIAEQLRSEGIKPKDKVGILFPNHPDYVASFFAVSALGATIVPINPLLKSDEIAHILSDSQSAALIVHESTLGEALKSQEKSSVLRKVFVSSSPSSNFNSRTCSAQNYELKGLCQKTQWHGGFAAPKINHMQDLALIVYTSGTTGKPKGAMLTHHNMLSVFPERLDLFDVSQDDNMLAVLPMCHIYGISILMLGTFSRGGKITMLPRFEAAEVLAAIEKEKVTLVPAVPAMYQFMVMELEQKPYDLSSVRICFCGAAPLPAELIAEVEKRFEAVLIEGFGMTETSCVGTINPLKGKRKICSVGPALPGVEIKILADNGEELPCGNEHVGEIWVKGPNIMQGYYRQEEASREVMKDGWFATGDLGYKDEDQYIFIVGRKKEMIIRGGANIYPREIESVISQLSQVAEVAVLGVPDKLMGERVKAVVVARAGETLTESELKAHCSEHLADYKIPRIFEFRSCLPRNSTGKVLKRLLQESED